MKIIQSFWSKPSLEKNHHRFSGGWHSEKKHAFSWALSCLLLLKHYDHVELITDLAGKEYFIDFLELPYTKYSTELESIHRVPSKFWAYGKVFSYSLQNKPFIHIDGDVFIWNRLEKLVDHIDIIAQNKFTLDDFSFEKRFRNTVLNEVVDLPEELQILWSSSSQKCWYNAGVFGGANIDFIESFSKKSLEFLESNFATTMSIETQLMNMIFEEHYLYAALKYQQLTPGLIYSYADPYLSQSAKFHMVPRYNSYIHAVNQYKRNDFICEHIEAHLKYSFPQFYTKLSSKFEKDRLPLDRRIVADEKGSIESTANSINEDSEVYYPRTSLLLSTIADRPVLNLNKLDIDTRIQSLRLDDLSFEQMSMLSSIYSFEKSRNRFAERRRILSLEAEDRIDYKIDLYKFIEGLSMSELLDAEFQLSNAVRIVDTKYYLQPFVKEEHLLNIYDSVRSSQHVLLYRHPITQNVEELELTGWDQFLVSFEGVVKMSQIVEFLLDHQDINVLEIENYKKEIIDFVLGHVHHTSILEFVNLHQEVLSN